MSEPRPGQQVRWNALGKRLFGDTKSEGLLVAVLEKGPGQTGRAGHVLWHSGQETWPTLDCLEAVPTEDYQREERAMTAIDEVTFVRSRGGSVVHRAACSRAGSAVTAWWWAEGRPADDVAAMVRQLDLRACGYCNPLSAEASPSATPRTVRLDTNQAWQRWVGDNRRRFSSVSYDPTLEAVVFMCHESYDRLVIPVGSSAGTED